MKPALAIVRPVRLILSLAFGLSVLVSGPAIARPGINEWVEAAGRSGLFELMSSAMYSTFERNKCSAPDERKDLDGEARFFSAARAEIEEQLKCSSGKIEALSQNRKLQGEVIQDLRLKIPELRYLKAIERAPYREAIDEIFDPNAPVMKSAQQEFRENPYQTKVQRRRERWLDAIRMARASYEAILATIPFSQNSVMLHFVERVQLNDLLDDAYMAREFPKVIAKVLARHREQLLSLRPDHALTRTAREDIVQNRSFAKSILKKVVEPDSRDRERLLCSLERRYGAGSEYLDNALFYGSFAIAAEIKGAQVVGKAAMGAAGMGRVSTVVLSNSLRLGAAMGKSFRNGFVGYFVMDSIRDYERLCRKTSPDHFRPRRGAASCDGRDLIDEMYESDCLSFVAFYAMGFNAARRTKTVAAESYLSKVDRYGVLASRAGLIGTTMIDSIIQNAKSDLSKKKAETVAETQIEKKTNLAKTIDEEDDEEDFGTIGSRRPGPIRNH